MRINTNMTALNAQRNLTNNTSSISKNVEKLSSGLRINRAADDAAGLSISEKMRSQIRGLNMATKNAQDGISLIQAAEGALNEYHSVLQRGRELAVQAANGTYVDADRTALQAEITQLVGEADRIAKTTQFNTMQLLDDTTDELSLQVGANNNEQISFSLADLRVSGDAGYFDGSTIVSAAATTECIALAGADVSTVSNASAAIDLFDDAIAKVSEVRSGLGAVQNRLDHTINNITTVSENLSAAESRIRDVDMASEMVEFTKNNILQQASTAMLAQANQLPSSVLQLLQ